MTIRAVRGVRDILPAETPKWQRVEETARRTFQAYGYEEIRLPLFERTELFARGIGEVTDIVQKEMYTFTDRGGDSITLRPEATASLLRAYIEHGLHVQPRPIRLYTIGPMFRYERPQAGRYRQFHQLDVEALGDDHPAVDVEVIAMLVEFFRRLGLAAPRVQLEINTLGDSVCRPRYREALVGYLRAHEDRLCDECRDRIERNPLRVLDCKKPECRPVLDAAPSLAEFLCEPCRTHFGRVRSGLDALGIDYVVAPRLVRGLDYYVRTTFELTTRELGAQNAVAGGGRYDGLIEHLGGPKDPGVGFAVGIERVVLMLGERDASADGQRPLALLIPLGEAAQHALLPVAAALRGDREPLRVDVAHGDRRLPRELERAGKLGARYAVIVGDDELGRGEAKVKDMTTREERTVKLVQLPEALRAMAGER
jgi:histidyl-tRNA synthetase